LNISHIGTAAIQTHSSILTLKDVACCPQASAQLLSINKLCKDNNVLFELTGTNFSVKDILTGDTLLTGPSENELYPINLRQLPSSKFHALTMTVGVKASTSTWHCRLGHPSANILHRVISKFSLPITGSIHKQGICVSCQLGKSKQLPFSDSSRESTTPLELIHSDVWSTFTPSLSGCRYYVIFIDDYTCFCWLFPISHKSDVYSTFVNFKLLVEKQFNYTIKQFQSDNGGEYCSTVFKQFLTTSGIFHRFSCPHTSQQNDIAERKHRHIIEIGLTLLAQSGLPKVFWVDAFLTSIFIINSLPTKVLDYSSPYERLFQRSPDFSYFHTFGCQCFPCLRPYSLDKLSYRSKPCIFIGYCFNHKGFWCFDPSSKRVYISRNVIFDEGIFPAREQSIFTDSANCLDSSGTSNTLFLPPSSPPFNFFPVPSSNIVSTHQTSLNITLPDNPISPLPSTHPDSSSPASLLHTPVLPADQPETFPNHSSSNTSLATLSNASHENASSDHSASELPLPNSSSRMLTRSQTGHSKPRIFPDFELHYTTRHPLQALHAGVVISEPHTYV
jgi:histone deacetylase 1/2